MHKVVRHWWKLIFGIGALCFYVTQVIVPIFTGAPPYSDSADGLAAFGLAVFGTLTLGFSVYIAFIFVLRTLSLGNPLADKKHDRTVCAFGLGLMSFVIPWIGLWLLGGRTEDMLRGLPFIIFFGFGFAGSLGTITLAFEPSRASERKEAAETEVLTTFD